MSYKLQKPITNKERADFIVEYNYKQNLSIEDGSDTYMQDNLTFKGDFIFALEPNEMMHWVEVEIDVPDIMEEGEEQTWHKETVEVYKPVINPDYEDEQTAKRQANFENNFLTTSLGNYRLLPKGYANAQQSIDTVNAMANAVGGLTELLANMVIFYETPDFTKEEECTEEWLVGHQIHPEPMTKEQWTQFYIEFSTLYAQKMYKKELANG